MPGLSPPWRSSPSPQLVTFTSNNNSAILPSSHQSVQAQAVADQYFPSVAGASGVIAVSATDGSELSTTDQQTVAALATSLTDDKIASVASVTTSPLYLSSNKKVQLVDVVFSGKSGDKGPTRPFRSSATGPIRFCRGRASRAN